jgi:hypothetical protein
MLPFMAKENTFRPEPAGLARPGTIGDEGDIPGEMYFPEGSNGSRCGQARTPGFFSCRYLG